MQAGAVLALFPFSEVGSTDQAVNGERLERRDPLLCSTLGSRYIPYWPPTAQSPVVPIPTRSRRLGRVGGCPDVGGVSVCCSPDRPPMPDPALSRCLQNVFCLRLLGPSGLWFCCAQNSWRIKFLLWVAFLVPSHHSG